MAKSDTLMDWKAGGRRSVGRQKLCVAKEIPECLREYVVDDAAWRGVNATDRAPAAHSRIMKDDAISEDAEPIEALELTLKAADVSLFLFQP